MVSPERLEFDTPTANQEPEVPVTAKRELPAEDPWTAMMLEEDPVVAHTMLRCLSPLASPKTLSIIVKG